MYNYLVNKDIDTLPNDFNVDSRIDPDSSNKKLYDDLNSTFFNENVKSSINVNSVENIEQGNPAFYSLFIDKNKHILSSDYLGPSVYWAKEFGYNDEQTCKWLATSRTIGGHILFPRGFTNGFYFNFKQKKYVIGKKTDDFKPSFITINIAKGGSTFYDRADWTFELLKIFYNNTSVSKDDYILECKKLLPKNKRDFTQYTDKFINIYYAFFNSKEWLEKFSSFKHLCDFFSLVGSFVDGEYNVIHFAPLFPILPKRYAMFAEKNAAAINNRTQQILNNLHKK